MSLARRLKTLERTMPRPVVTPATETRDLDQYRVLMDASAMRADGRLAPGAYLDGMIDWQREMLDTYGEAMATLMFIGRKSDVDQVQAGGAGTPCQGGGIAAQPGLVQP
jgi:hypothetical protein